MNDLLRFVIFVWLLMCAFAAWVGAAFIGFLFAFTSYNHVYEITPFIGFTVAACTIRYAVYVLLNTNPATYIANKFRWIIGKATI